MSGRKVAIAACVAALTLALTGCISTTPDPTTTRTDGMNSSDFKEVEVKLRDGRTVLCLTTGSKPSPSCDWAGAK